MRIAINKSDALKPKIEDVTEFDESIFKQVYLNAIKQFNEIINSNKEGNKYKQSYCYDKTNQSSSNIIAFVGDRGTGKTSAMVSFSNSISKLGYSFKDESLREEYKKIDYAKIEVMDVIDPSVFDENDSLIEIIIANMFKVFKEHVERQSTSEENTRKLIKNFQKVYKNLQVIHSGKKNIYDGDIDDLEDLIDLASSTKLRENLSELVDNYLKLMNNEKGLLVLQIDDLDLNFKNGYRMFEDIRKHFSLNNVVILISVKFEQLKALVYEEYLDLYKHSQDINIKNTIDDLTQKYLEKLLPLNRRILLPDLFSLEALNISFLIGSKEIGLNSEGIQELIIKVVYYATGFLIYKPRFGTSDIIPKTLRELVQFMVVISEFKTDAELKASDDEKRINFQILCKYYVSLWSVDKFESIVSSFVYQLFASDINRVNYMIIKFLVNRLLKISDNLTLIETKLKIKNIINAISEERSLSKKEQNVINKMVENIKYIETFVEEDYSDVNISIGSVLCVIEICDRYFLDHDDTRMINCIKLIYSLILYREIYYPITYNNFIDNSKYEEDEEDEGNIKDQQELIYEDINNNFKILVSGDLYGEFAKLSKVKNQLYKLITDVKINFDKILINGISMGEMFKKSGMKNIDEYRLSENDSANILCLFLVISPILGEEGQKKIRLREDVLSEYRINILRQKNFEFNGSKVLTNIFYINDIFNYISENINKKVNIDELSTIINDMDEWIKENRKYFLFYNVDYMLSLFNSINSSANKVRIGADNYFKFMTKFTELFVNEHKKIVEGYCTDKYGAILEEQVKSSLRKLFDTLPVLKIINNQNNITKEFINKSLLSSDNSDDEKESINENSAQGEQMGTEPEVITEEGSKKEEKLTNTEQESDGKDKEQSQEMNDSIDSLKKNKTTKETTVQGRRKLVPKKTNK